MNLKTLIHKFENIGVLKEQSNNKKIAINNFNWLLFWVFIASILWSFMLYFIGQPLAALIPILAAVIIPIILLGLHKSKKLNAPFNAFLIMMLILPALVQLFNGGLINSGAVILWSTMAPMMALAFKPTFEAKRCFAFFLFIVLLEMTVETYALPSHNNLSVEIIKFQFLINIIGVVTICFFPLLAFTKKLNDTKRAISTKNRTIGENFRYAENIQANVLPSEEELSSILSRKAFVIFKPKELISGDFYWAYQDNKCSVVVCADFTGHGVTSAFNTLTATSHLNNIVKEGEKKDPSEIMTSLHYKIITSFDKTKDIIEDTIKMSICVIDKQEKIITYASSKSKIYFFNGISVTKYKTDPFKVGDRERQGTFVNRTIKYKSGDILYLSTKGFMNQFGERDDKKLKAKNLARSMNKYGPFPIENQKNLFLNKLAKWQGNLLQTEDITLIGIEL